MKNNYYLLLFFLLSFWGKSFSQSPGCPNVVIADVSPICNPGDCMTLSASFLRTGETTSYSVSPIDYAPPFPFIGGNYVALEGDDDWSELIDLGFNFCFFGNSYNKALITDNGALTFSIAGFGGQYQPGSTNAGYQFNEQIPFVAPSGPPYASSIMGVLQDTYAAASASGPNKSINYQVLGAYPCRTLVFNIYEIGQWSCHTNSGTQTSQMVIYEGTNVIEVYVEKRTPCETHNSGSGVIGIQNENGTLGYAPPGRNTGTWSAFNEAWRFTPAGEKNYDLQWYIDDAPVPSDIDENGVPLETLTICPTQSHLVKAIVVYSQCSGAPIVVQDEKLIEYTDPPVLGEPRNLQECADVNGNGTFNLNVVKVDLTTDPLYQFNFFNSFEDAESNSNSLASTYILAIADSPKTIWVRVSNLLTACYYIKSFQLEVKNCELNLNNLPDLKICEGELNQFNLNQYDSVVYNNNLSFVVSYHNSEDDATIGVNAIPNTETSAYEATNGETIWVRVQQIDNAAIYGVTSFKLFVHEKPIVYDLDPVYGCEIPGTGLANFDLSSVELQATGLANSLEVSFYPTFAEAELGDVANSFPLNYTGEQGTIYVRVYNPNTGCFSIMPLVTNVVTTIIANEIAPLVYCSASSNGFGYFNLEATRILIAGNPVPTGVQVTYHETLADATNNVNAIENLVSYSNIVANNQTLYVRVGYINSVCSSIVPLQLIAYPTPAIVTPTPLTVCDVDNNSVANFDLTTKIPEILNGLNPSLYTVSFYTSEANAVSGLNAISNPTNYSNLTSQFVFVKVTDNVTGCFKIVALQLVASSAPVVANPIPTYQLCDDNFDGFQTFDLSSKVPSIVGAQTGLAVSFHYTAADANSGSNALASPYQNVAQNVQTIYVRVAKVNTGCYVVTTMDIRVSPIPVLTIPTTPFAVCSSGQSGFGSIDLTSFESQLLNGGPAYVLSYFETQANAQNNVFSIANPTEYNNLQPTNPVVWVRAVDQETGCFSVSAVTFQLVVAPRMPLTLPMLETCDVHGNLYDGFSPIDLTQQTQLILDAQTVSADYVIRYYTTEALANAGTNWISNPESFINSTNPQTIWVRIHNAAHPTTCFVIKSFDIKISTPLFLGLASPIVVCNEGLPNDSSYVFDLTVRENQITQGQVFGTTITYHLTEAGALSGGSQIGNPTAYSNISNPQTIWVSVVNMYGCKSVTTLTVRVLPLPEPNMNPLPLVKCEDELGGTMASFDLRSSEVDLSNGDTSLSYTYFFSSEDAINNTNAIDTPEDYFTETSTVYVRVTNNPGLPEEQCFVIVELQLIVNSLPQIGPMTPLYVCNLNATGFHTFNLQDKNEQALANQNPSNFSVRYYIDEESANEGLLPLSYTYTNVFEDVQEIFVRVENLSTGCYSIAPFNLVVEEKVFAYPPSDNLTFCDTDGVNDGLTNVDLSGLSTGIISEQNLTGDLQVRYYNSWSAYNLGEASVTTSFPVTSNPQLVIAEVFNPQEGSLCTATVEFYITVNKAPSFDPIPDGYVCPDFRTQNVQGYLMDTKLPASGHTFVWTRNGQNLNSNTPSFLAEQAGTYQVTVTSTSTNCSYSQTIIVQEAPALTIDQVNVTDGFSDTNVIEVIASAPVGVQIEYALDEGAFQDSNIFMDVLPGTHTVWVRAKGMNVCAQYKIVNVLNYPKFFTPNNDGYNDTWNISALKDQPESKIYIFDRHGKLLKQISPAGAGWDGTLNNQPLPSTDYWFRAEYIEPNTGLQKEATGHFTLKR